jgi:DNA-binding NtrC family response regulator
MRKVRLQAGLLVNIDVPVPILGESGPERNRGSAHPHVIVATAIQFLKVNCARVAEEAISSYPVLTGPDPHLFCPNPRRAP